MQGKTSAGNPLCKKLPAMAGALLLAVNAAAGAYNHERQQIGLAWSADGVNFTRWRDTPVLPHGAEGSWNAWESGHPGVFEDDDGQIYLFYQGKATLNGDYRLSCLKVEFVD